MNNSSRRPLVILALIAVIALFILQLRSLLDDPTILLPDDFVEYWAAGRLNAHGEIGRRSTTATRCCSNAPSAAIPTKRS